MNTCKHCNKVLAGTKYVHVMDGYLYCSEECAIVDTMEYIISNAKETAIQQYREHAEVVSTTDILKEDMRHMDVTVCYTKRIELPADYDKDIVSEIAHLFESGELNVEQVNWNNVNVIATLVDDTNSEV